MGEFGVVAYSLYYPCDIFKHTHLKILGYIGLYWAIYAKKNLAAQ